MGQLCPTATEMSAAIQDMSAKNVFFQVCPQKMQKEMHAIRYGGYCVLLRTYLTADLTLCFCGHILWRTFHFAFLRTQMTVTR